MNDARFDAWTRRLQARHSRRMVAPAVLTAAIAIRSRSWPAAAVSVGQVQRACPSSRQCEERCCKAKHFCCDPTSQTCCAKGAECCNPGSGTGSCCAKPNRCGLPYGDDAAPASCCPPTRQWTTAANVLRCCPEDTHALPNGAISTNGGPCCPTAAYCHGHCCEVGSQCVGGACCLTEQVCGATCCPAGQTCVNGHCASDSVCPQCEQDGNLCCPPNTANPRGYCCPPGCPCSTTSSWGCACSG